MLEFQKYINENTKFAITVKNLKTGELYNLNENLKLTSASIIKIYIMGEAMRQVKASKLSLETKIIVNEDVKVDYSILTMLQNGNSYTILDIITLMIVQSDNTATNILIDILSMECINEFIQSLGLSDTVLQRKMMDIKARKEGRENYTSTRDTAKYLELLYNNQIVDEVYSKLMIKIMKWQLDRSMMMLYIEDKIEAAHKTGDLKFINNDSGIIFAPKAPYIFSMMVWDADSNINARLKIAEVSKGVYDYFAEEVI